MVKKFDVSITVTSETLSLSEIASLLGREPQSGSHDKGEPRVDGSTWGTSILRFNASEPDVAFHSQCMQLLKDWNLSHQTFEELSVNLDVAILYDTFTCGFELPVDLIDELAKQKIGVEVSTYPTEFQAGD